MHEGRGYDIGLQILFKNTKFSYVSTYGYEAIEWASLSSEFWVLRRYSRHCLMELFWDREKLITITD